MIFAHVNRLLSLKPMKTESFDELKVLLNSTVDSINQLKILKSPVDHWDHFLVSLTVNRLDKISLRDWENSIAGSVEPPTFNELGKFLTNRLETLEAVCSSSSDAKLPQEGFKIKSSSQGRKNSDNFSKNSNFKIHSVVKENPPKEKPPVQIQSVQNNSCFFCNKPHYIASCTDFRGKSAKERLEFVEAQRLCYNCLGRHSVKNCKT